MPLLFGMLDFFTLRTLIPKSVCIIVMGIGKSLLFLSSPMAFEVTSKSVEQILPRWAESAVLVGLYVKSKFENSSFFLQSSIVYDVIGSSIGFVCIHQQMTCSICNFNWI